MAVNLWEQALSLSRAITSMQTMFEIRRRVNPHHSKKDVAYEKKRFDEEQSRLFFTLKLYYTSNRDALVKDLVTLNESDRKQAQQTIDALDKCITDDIERTLLA